MEKFMLILREDGKKLGRMSLEERFLILPIMMEWVKSIADAGHDFAGEPLGFSGFYVTQDSVLSDGPFIEAKEAISGYSIISADNIEQALSFAKSCPVVVRGMGALEVRPILVSPGETKS
jgi:hypothetical protein